MIPKAIYDAKRRLTRAKEKLGKMRADNSFTFEEFEDAWEDLLSLINTIFSKLEQGAKCNKESKVWFDNIKHKRKNDPLLSYIRQARNSEEHTLTGTTDKTGFTIQAVGKGTRVLRSGHKDNHLHVVAPRNVKAGEELFRIQAPGIYLLNVTCKRSGKLFPVPKTHLGQNIEHPTPIAVASLAIVYVEEMIEAAEALIMED